MDEGRDFRSQQIIDAVLGADPSARPELIERLCAGDAALREFVEAAVEDLLEQAHAPTAPMPTPSDLFDGAGSERAVPGMPRVDGYANLRPISRGGMGVVYLAEQHDPVRRQVALKVIAPGASSDGLVARFERERQMQAALSHPNIAAIFSAGTTREGSPYYTMEYVDGEPVTRFCDRRRLPLHDRLQIFARICDAVQHAHQNAVIHRDIKPSNVLVCEHGEQRVPKVIDFGVAKVLGRPVGEVNRQTAEGVIIGTPGYMSPEQTLAGQKPVDTRTDIYALGVLLYEIVTGTPPFDLDVLPQELLHRIRTQVPPRPSSRVASAADVEPIPAARSTDQRGLVRSLRGELDWITMKAIEKEPDRRYASAAELAADVRRYLNLEPVLAGPPGAGYRVRMYVRRHRKAIVWGAAAVLVASAGVVATRTLIERRQAGLTQSYLEVGESALAELRGAEQDMMESDTLWQTLERNAETWQPVWERDEIIQTRAELTSATERALVAHDDALRAFNDARATAPSMELRRRAELELERLYFEQYSREQQNALQSRSADLLKQSIEALGLGTFAADIAGNRHVELRSDPPGAEVYAFRYVSFEQRLVPRSWRDGKTLDEPQLIVEAIWRDDAGPFEVGDQLSNVHGRQVGTESDLAAVLAGVGEDEVIRVQVRRQDSLEEHGWVPFPATLYASARETDPVTPLRPGRLLSSHDQLGLTFVPYQLIFSSENSVGTTQQDAPLELDLEEGSYLFVFRKPGFADARLPVSVPLAQPLESVRMVHESDVPPNFVYIPGGWFECGGDPEAFQSLPQQIADVDGFFIDRYEVSVSDYLEFLNSPEILSRLQWDKDDNEVMRPVSVEVKRLLKPDEHVIIIRRERTRVARFNKERGRWELASTAYERLPTIDIPQLAAREYAHWKTRHDPNGFVYRLPTDLEWEKAARGADRRIYSWGDYMVWSFCWSMNAAYDSIVPRPCGISPIDESVYGVRDMTGSASEWTTGRPNRDHDLYRSYRGGHWNTPDEYYFRSATRNGMAPTGSSIGIGFRLVAELKKSS